MPPELSNYDKSFKKYGSQKWYASGYFDRHLIAHVHILILPYKQLFTVFYGSTYRAVARGAVAAGKLSQLHRIFFVPENCYFLFSWKNETS